MLAEPAVGAKNHDGVAKTLQVIDRVPKPRDDAIHFGEERLGKESDAHRESATLAQSGFRSAESFSLITGPGRNAGNFGAIAAIGKLLRNFYHFAHQAIVQGGRIEA